MLDRGEIMDKNKLQYYKNRLVEEKRNVTEAMEGMLENGLAVSQGVETQELSVIDNHPGDMGTEMFDKGRRFALIRNEQDIINKIEDAIDRIENEDYGNCELCGREIPEERLEFMPYANTCIDCEVSKADYTTYRYDRPVEEEVLDPYGTYFMDVSGDQEDEIMYDGEDAWQDVAKYEMFPGRNEGEYDDNFSPEADEGIVEFTDGISNQQYKDQLP
jgi:YteA family regulatory protein